MSSPQTATHAESMPRIPQHGQARAGTAYTSGSVCSLCDADNWMYLFVSHGGPIYRCTNCGLTRLHPQPTTPEFPACPPDHPGRGPLAADASPAGSQTEQEAARSYSRALENLGASNSTTLLIAPRSHPFVSAIGSHSYRVDTFLDVEELSRAELGEGRYDAAVIIFQLEKAANPIAILERIHGALKQDGVLLVVAPSIDSWPARLFRGQWPEWRKDNLYYFDTQTIQSALLRSGFARVRITRDRRRYSLQHIYDRAMTLPVSWLTQTIRAIYRIVPAFLHRGMRLMLATSGMVITARRVERRARPLLSIIMPVYNERATFEVTMNAVVAKDVPGVDKEMIVVESNSTDGTRELALGYRDVPNVTLVLEDRPRGKGRAVRTGFEHARGDFILIQDGDREYDVNDYDALIEPLRSYRRAFVLGSRHMPRSLKMRQFSDQPGIAILFNLGHFLFATTLNLLYGQRLKDPFTMYKVFRRDCLHGLRFECDRFDFDFELVIKLLRKGYVPLEIPVNYRSRSLKQGKKVSMLRDPLTWIRALIRFRWSPLYEPANERKKP